mgnify:CR=1 FL=1
MTEKALYEKLSNILETIDREKYTDIVSIIECNIEDDGTVYMDAFDFACELHNADGAEILPKKVADLLIEIYLEEIENEIKGTAAKIATKSGADMIIANSVDVKILGRLILGSEEGTLFLGNKDENFDLKEFMKVVLYLERKNLLHVNMLQNSQVLTLNFQTLNLMKML